MFLTFIDAIGAFIQKRASVENQIRLGVIMCVLSIPLVPLGFAVAPPTSVEFLIYQMSAAALLFGGLSTVVAAVPSEE